jgi:hypothetical protein
MRLVEVMLLLLLLLLLPPPLCCKGVRILHFFFSPMFQATLSSAGCSPPNSCALCFKIILITSLILRKHSRQHCRVVNQSRLQSSTAIPAAFTTA